MNGKISMIVNCQKVHVVQSTPQIRYISNLMKHINQTMKILKFKGSHNIPQLAKAILSQKE